MWEKRTECLGGGDKKEKEGRDAQQAEQPDTCVFKSQWACEYTPHFLNAEGKKNQYVI